jgi:DNA topoisomerase-1
MKRPEKSDNSNTILLTAVDPDDVPLAQKMKSIKESKAKEEEDNVPLAVKLEKIAKERAKKEKIKVIDKVPSKKSSQNGNGKIEKKVKKSEANEVEREGEDEENEEYKWWESQLNDHSVKWTTLEHNGVCFPPEYVPHKVPLIYDGQEIVLEPEAEEVAGFFGALIATDYAANPIFVKNFFEDFQQVLRDCNSQWAKLIKDFNKCDFTLMHQHFERLKEKRKLMTKEDKEKIKADKASIIEKYGYCLIDGRKERIGNFMVEPPGLFRGRGKHPKAGKLKLRVRPEQITINIGKDAKIPPPPPGRHWGAIQYDNTVTWLATWVENINKAQKYVFLAPESSLKGRSDMQKFEKARQLKGFVKEIRKINAVELRSKEMLVRQRATALWLIDHLALRAGNEKGDDEADTVGCCSLRLEHLKLVEPNIIVFDFLGKDSIRYYNEVPVDPIIFKNLGIFMRPPKTPNDPIFDRLTVPLL